MAASLSMPDRFFSLGNIVVFIKSWRFIIELRSERRYVCTMWKTGKLSIRKSFELDKELEARCQATMALQQRRTRFPLGSSTSSETSANFSAMWRKQDHGNSPRNAHRSG